MSNKRVLNNGDVFRVIQNNGGRWLKTWLIQAKESSRGKNRYCVIGGNDTLQEAIAEMNRRADEIEKLKIFA